MTIAGACRPPTRDYAGGWQAAGGLLSTLLDRFFMFPDTHGTMPHQPHHRDRAGFRPMSFGPAGPRQD